MQYLLLTLFCLYVTCGSSLRLSQLGKQVKKIVTTVPLLIGNSLPLSKQTRSITSTNSIQGGFNLKPGPLFRQPLLSPAPRREQPTQQESAQRPQFIRNAVKSVGQSVVRIDCEREVSQLMSLFSENFREGDVIRVSGTGIVATGDGYILTNAHVVEQAKKVTITLSSGRSFKAQVIQSDELTDLAVLKADLSKEKDFKLQTAPMGDSSVLHAGDWVIAVGCPVGLDFTVTLGVVSSPHRSASEIGAPHLRGSYIQTDAALNSGNSGGPLVNDRGEVVGINTMVRSNSEAIGFALPINRALSLLPTLQAGKKPAHAYFGLELSSLTPDFARIHNEDPNSVQLPEREGAMVTRVVLGSPADLAGVRRLDLLVSVGGSDVKGADEAEALLDNCPPDRKVRLQFLRGLEGAEVGVEATPQDLQVLLQMRRKLQQSVFVLKPPAAAE